MSKSGSLGAAKSESSSPGSTQGSRFNKRRKVFSNYIREIQELLPDLNSKSSTADVLERAIHYITSQGDDGQNSSTSLGPSGDMQSQVDHVFLDLIDDVVLVVDPTGYIHYASPSCRRHLQFTQHQLIGHRIYEYIFYQNVPDVMVWLNSQANSTVTFRIRCRPKPSGQDTVWISARKQPLGRDNMLVCSLTILPSNGTTSLVDHAMGPAEGESTRLIMLHDTNSRAVFVWASSDVIAGFELSSLVGLVPGQYHHPDDRPRMGMVARDALMRCKPFTDVSRVANPLIGQWLYSSSHMRPLIDRDSGQMFGILAVGTVTPEPPPALGGVVCEDEVAIVTTALQTMSIIEAEIGKQSREARMEEIHDDQDDQPIKMEGTPPIGEFGDGSRAMSPLDIDRELLASLGADLLPFLFSGEPV